MIRNSTCPCSAAPPPILCRPSPLLLAVPLVRQRQKQSQRQRQRQRQRQQHRLFLHSPVHHVIPCTTCGPPERMFFSEGEPGALHDVRVVLVGPQHAGNVGSVCRAAANFECRDIFLVNPDCDPNSQDGFNAASNPISRELLRQARIESSLPQALESCTMAVAFTRRVGKIRLPSFTLSDLISPDHKNLKLALVFGREDCGLHTDELLQCTHVCTISTGSWQGSLNLSHAVTVVLSRLYESWAPKQSDIYDTARLDSVAYKTLPGTASIVDVENVLYRWEHVFNSCNDLSKLAGLPEYKTPERFFLFLRKLLFRARPSIREVAYLHGFLTVLENLVSVVSKVERNRDEDCD